MLKKGKGRHNTTHVNMPTHIYHVFVFMRACLRVYFACKKGNKQIDEVLGAYGSSGFHPSEISTSSQAHWMGVADEIAVGDFHCRCHGCSSCHKHYQYCFAKVGHPARLLGLLTKEWITRNFRMSDEFHAEGHDYAKSTTRSPLHHFSRLAGVIIIQRSKYFLSQLSE